MPKQTGLGWTTLDVDDSAGVAQDLRDNTTNFEFSTPIAVQETTGVDKYAIERLLLLADFSITMNGVADFDAADSAHSILKDVGSTRVARDVTIVISGQTLTNNCLLTDYALTRGDDGSLVWSCPGVLANGIAPTWS